MSTALLLRKLIRRGSSLGRSVTAGRGRRHAIVEALEERQLFSLLGVVPGVPGGFYAGAPGSANYNAAAQTLDAVGVPLTFFDAANVSYSINAPQGFDFHIKVDNSGNLIGSGAFANDLVITGSIDLNNDSIPEYSGTLLTGKIAQFGWDSDGVTGYFDARLTVTGGTMAALFAGKNIGLAFVAEPSDPDHLFAGDWTVNATGLTKGTFGVIPGSGGPPLNITGHKFKDVAGDGLAGNDNVPLGNWTIELYADTNNNNVLDGGDLLIDTAVTAAGTGAYAFNNLSAGKYFVKEVQQPGWVATGPASGQYTVNLTTLNSNNNDFANYKCDCACDPKPNCNWNWICGGNQGGSCGTSSGYWKWVCFKGHWGKTWCSTGGNNNNTCNSGNCNDMKTLATAKSSISGSVFNDVNCNGKQDRCEDGISGVKITLTGTDLLGNTVTRTTYTDSNGDYKFKDLIAGKYTITESNPGGSWLDGKDYAGSNGGVVENDKISCITLPPCSDLKNYNFTEKKAASICGNVFNDKDGDGKFDCTEKGIAGVKITLSGYDCNGAWVSITTTTDSCGNYSFTGLQAGTYTLCETQPSGYSSTKNSAGSEGGNISGDKISGITLESGDKACGYNFGEKQTSSGGRC